MKPDEIVCCPDCGANPLQNTGCDNCGRQFDDDAGTPKLFPQDNTVSYPVRYVSLEAVQEALSRTLDIPAQSGAHNGVFHLDRAHVLHMEALPKGSMVLEIGCGGGQMRRWVEGLGLRYAGTDISKTRISEWLQEYGGPDFLSDVHHLPVRDASVDLVYSAAVTEHLAAPQRAVQEIFRVLKPGGLFLGNCSFMEPWHDESFYHTSPNGAAALLLQAGFEIEAVWPSHNYSGYMSLLSMGNKATRAVRFLGHAMNAYSRAFYGLKRRIKGPERYTSRDLAADLAITAGAVDWTARKPG